jgi:hypothetical protein
MQARFASSLASVLALIAALRDAIENTVTNSAEGRLRLLLDAIDAELRLLMSVDGHTGSLAIPG